MNRCAHFHYLKEALNEYIEMLEEEVRSGDTSSLIMLSDLYKIDGRFSKAFECLKKAADLGDEFGIERLGHEYYYGKIVEQDYEKAFFYLSGRKLMSLAGTYILSDMYYRGLAVEKDQAAAFNLLENAIWDIILSDDDGGMLDDSYPKACERLALMYANGLGVDADEGMAYFLEDEADRARMIRPGKYAKLGIII